MRFGFLYNIWRNQIALDVVFIKTLGYFVCVLHFSLLSYKPSIVTDTVNVKGLDEKCFTFDANAPNVVAFQIRWHDMSASPKIQTEQARRVGRLACTMLEL